MFGGSFGQRSARVLKGAASFPEAFKHLHPGWCLGRECVVLQCNGKIDAKTQDLFQVVDWPRTQLICLTFEILGGWDRNVSGRSVFILPDESAPDSRLCVRLFWEQADLCPVYSARMMGLSGSCGS